MASSDVMDALPPEVKAALANAVARLGSQTKVATELGVSVAVVCVAQAVSSASAGTSAAVAMPFAAPAPKEERERMGESG
mgnify:CR=1 FL=1